MLGRWKFAFMIGAVLTAVGPVRAATPLGTFNVTLGLTNATVQTTTVSGGSSSTSNGKNLTGTAFGAEYLFSNGGRFSAGPSLLSWSLPGADSLPATSATAVGAAIAYRVSDGGSAHIVLGNEFRMGYSQSLSSNPSNGLFAVAELVAPQKDHVDSFGYFGIGYRFH